MVDHGTVSVEFPQTMLSPDTARSFGRASVIFGVLEAGLAISTFFLFSVPMAIAMSLLCGMMWAPLFGVYLMYRSGSRKHLTIEFTPRGVSQSGMGAGDTYLTWHEVGRLFMARKLGSRTSGPFPAMLVLQRAGQDVPVLWSDLPLALQPGLEATPQFERITTELVRRAAAGIVDPEVILFLGALRSVLASAGGANESSSVSWRGASLLGSATMDYFGGRVSESLAEASSAQDWEMTLCAALCSRALGRLDDYRRLLAKSASGAPEEFAAVLLAAERAIEI